jgi:hypothetical protein
MFTSSLRESGQDEIELMNVDGDALWALVLYCYTGNFICNIFDLRKHFENINNISYKYIESIRLFFIFV